MVLKVHETIFTIITDLVLRVDFFSDRHDALNISLFFSFFLFQAPTILQPSGEILVSELRELMHTNN